MEYIILGKFFVELWRIGNGENIYYVEIYEKI